MQADEDPVEFPPGFGVVAGGDEFILEIPLEKHRGVQPFCEEAEDGGRFGGEPKGYLFGLFGRSYGWNRGCSCSCGFKARC